MDFTQALAFVAPSSMVLIFHCPVCKKMSHTFHGYSDFNHKDILSVMARGYTNTIFIPDAESISFIEGKEFCGFPSPLECAEFNFNVKGLK
jgi:hypothetical protein